ncbi:MAG: hypothetical protein ACLP1X_20285 [Polyangiaceae bacterium]
MSAVNSPAPDLFRTKGLVHAGAVEFWEATVPGGAEAVRATLVDSGQADAARFYETRFVPGGWYPVLPVLTSAVAAARLRRKAVGDHVRENSAWIAQRDLRGVYRVILSVASVDAVASRLGGLSMRYFDFGSADTRAVGRGGVDSDRVGIPAALGPWFNWCAEGFVPVALTMAGAQSVDVRTSQPAPDGTSHGVATVRLHFEIRWT